MNISCLGVSHKTAALQIREKYAVSLTNLSGTLERLLALSGVEEAVVISTCNRTEFYLVSSHSSTPGPDVRQHLYGEIPPEEASCFFWLPAHQAVRHLFRVVSGLESMVVGETEIFGQVKRAYEAALHGRAAGKILNRLFQKSFQVGKQVRATTGVTKGSVSVGSVAVEVAEQIFGDLTGCRIMILGAGETSEKTGRAFQTRGTHQVFVSNRSYQKAEMLAASLGAQAVRFEDWAKHFEHLDILVSSTSAPHYLVTSAKLEPLLRERRNRPLFIIDLAVPRDVDPEVHRLDGVYLYDLDALQIIARQTVQARLREAEASIQLIEKHALDFQTWLDHRLPTALPDAPVESPGI